MSGRRTRARSAGWDREGNDVGGLGRTAHQLDGSGRQQHGQHNAHDHDNHGNNDHFYYRLNQHYHYHNYSERE